MSLEYPLDGHLDYLHRDVLVGDNVWVAHLWFPLSDFLAA